MSMFMGKPLYCHRTLSLISTNAFKCNHLMKLPTKCCGKIILDVKKIEKDALIWKEETRFISYKQILSADRRN